MSDSNFWGVASMIILLTLGMMIAHDIGSRNPDPERFICEAI